MSLINYMDLCRLCLVKDRASIPIFEDEGYARQILHKINTCRLPVEVLQDDHLPKKICDDCANKVEVCYQLWSTTLNAGEQLRKLIGEVSLEDKLDFVVQYYNSDAMVQESISNSRLEDAAMQVIEHQDIMNMEMLDNTSIITMSAASEQFISVSGDTNNTLPETSYLEDISNSTCVQIPNSALLLDHISDSYNLTSSFFDDFPDPELIADSELLPYSISETEFIPHSFPEPEFIPHSFPEPEFIPPTIDSPVSKPPPLPFQETILDSTDLDLNANVTLANKRSTRKRSTNKKSIAKKWSKPNNKERVGHLREKYYCPKCMVGFSDKVKFGQHQVQEHQINQPFICDVCHLGFSSAFSINRHKKLHDPKANPFLCHLCDYRTRQKSNLTMHIKCCHEKNYSYKCETCGAGFMQRTKFSEHLELHQAQTTHACKLCTRAFIYKRNLRHHMRKQHPGTIPEPVVTKNRISCGQCNKQFAKEQSLQRHVKAHHSEPYKKLPCSECKALLSSKSALAQHMRSVHRREKVGACNVCGKGFAKLQNLRAHERIHTGERPYKCMHCTARFKQKTPLKHHIWTHMGERPHYCDQCGRGFVSRSLLAKHDKTAHKKVQTAAPADGETPVGV